MGKDLLRGLGGRKVVLTDTRRVYGPELADQALALLLALARGISPVGSGRDNLIELHGKPRALRLDNGPELTAIAFTEWCTSRGIEAQFIQPGKLDQNAFIERFNKTYRDEVLDAYVFETVEQVREITETWLHEYNEERPHDSLGRVPPLMFMPRPHPRKSP